MPERPSVRVIAYFKKLRETAKLMYCVHRLLPCFVTKERFQ